MKKISVKLLLSFIAFLAVNLWLMFKGAAKGSAIGLAVYAGYKTIRNIFGLGTPGSLTK